MPNRQNDSLVSVSESTQVTFHQLQDIYNTLTGKFERISQRLDRAYQVKLEDLIQLNHKIVQCSESYGAELKNESVTVYHINGQKDTYSSFQRFTLYNQSTTTPVENVSIEYNILVIPAGTSKAVQYRIRINLGSRAAFREKSPASLIGRPDFFRLFGEFNSLGTSEKLSAFGMI